MQSAKINGSRLRAIREERELTTTQVAALLSTELGRPIHQSTISKYENGRRQPKARTFGALCRVLRVDDRNDLLIPNDLEATA